MCNKKSCWTCKHSKDHRYFGDYGDYLTPPESPSVEGCDKNISEDLWDKALEIMDVFNIPVEDTMPNLCIQYEEEIVTCINCGYTDFSSKMRHWLQDGYSCNNEECINVLIDMGI